MKTPIKKGSRVEIIGSAWRRGDMMTVKIEFDKAQGAPVEDCITAFATVMELYEHGICKISLLDTSYHGKKEIEVDPYWLTPAFISPPCLDLVNWINEYERPHNQLSSE